MSVSVTCNTAVFCRRHAIGIAEDAEERTPGETGEFGNKGNRIMSGGQQVGGISQTIVIEETAHAFAIGTGTDGIGNIMLIGAEKLSQAEAVQIGVGINVFRAVHQFADAAEELLVRGELFLRLRLQLLDDVLFFALTLFFLNH